MAIIKVLDEINMRAEVVSGSHVLYLIDGHSHAKYINTLDEKKSVGYLGYIDIGKLERYLQRYGVMSYDDCLELEK